jgi:hypothetical protein
MEFYLLLSNLNSELELITSFLFTFTSNLHLNAAIGKIFQRVSALIFLRGGCLGDFFAGF